MAYASLANVNLVYGIYTAIFPVIIYTLLGPSRHVSMGKIRHLASTTYIH